VQQLFDTQRVMLGQKTSTELSKEEKAVDKNDFNVYKIPVDTSLFKDFPDVHAGNEADFEYVSGYVILKYIESGSDKALEFPSIVHQNGRVII
jgi:hypothetical protein